ncbi:hypothetical protein GCM10010271_02920 [Streptomyces kurssanovii]|nr:hypothetical protein GCM10010271_02920 [Streptomyces kurssanovii]
MPGDVRRLRARRARSTTTQGGTHAPDHAERQSGRNPAHRHAVPRGRGHRHHVARDARTPCAVPASGGGPKAASGHDRRHAELRATVQRTLKSQKGKNIPAYAEYIAAGILGKHGSAWSTPPITLWHAGEIAAMSDELVPDSGLRTLTVAPDAIVIAIDGETQTTAWHDIYQDPESLGLTYTELSRRVRIPF